MRSPVVVASFLLACAGFAGCTSSAGIEDLMPRPSSEVTSSIRKAEAPAPAVDIANATADVSDDDPQPQVIAQPERGPMPKAETIAMVAPDRPSAGVKVLQAETINPRRFRDAKPINFGKASPKHLAVHGV